jgi:Protein of unknown function (DUF3311)
MPADGSAHVDRVVGTREAVRRRRRWNWLLLVPLALLVYPGMYSRSAPVWLGFPFFYWYQFAVVVLTALLTGLVYWATRPPVDENDSA